MNPPARASRYKLEVRPAVADQLARLAHSPRPADQMLLKQALTAIRDIADGREDDWPGHRLGLHKTTADLRDCHTIQLVSSARGPASHRLVWRELPTRADGTMPRELIALGERGQWQVYDIAGAELNREVGQRLPELDRYDTRRDRVNRARAEEPRTRADRPPDRNR